MDQKEAVTQAAVLPKEVYYILGVIILSNLGVIVTVLGAAFRVVYKFAVLQTQTKALHRRVDMLEKKSYPPDTDDNDDL